MLGHDLDTGQPAGPVPCTPAFRQYHFGMGFQSRFLQASGTTCFKHHCGLSVVVVFACTFWSSSYIFDLEWQHLRMFMEQTAHLAKLGELLFAFCRPTGSSMETWARFSNSVWEATHPGPAVCSDSRFQTIRFCVTNPTSLAQKSDVRADRAKKNQCDVISLSETAATEAAQKTFSKLVGKHQLRCRWSPPVPSFRNTITGKPREKGNTK